MTIATSTTDGLLEVRDAGALEPYRAGVDGPWGRAQAAHLARRAGLGVPPALLEHLAAGGPSAAIERFFDLEVDPASEALLQTARAVNSIETAQNWWLHQMLEGAGPLREKVALFWHGHFATSNAKVDNARMMLDQIELFRREGLGSFEPLVQRVAKDPAMLVWLDGNSNRVGAPNENFARELMELFTLGIGNYSEQDIKQAARAFTGWHVRGISYWFNERAHDTGEKRLLGRSDIRSGEEVVTTCVERRASSRFVASKLFAYFVHPRPAESLVDLLADAWEASERHTGRFLRRLLASRVFYSDAVRRSIIASPVDYAVGTIRTLDANVAPGKLAGHLRDMGQDLLQPPSVKGWDGGRAWISSTSLIARLAFVLALVEGEPLGARIAWGSLGDVVERCFPDGLDAELRARLEAAGRGDPQRVLAAILQLPEYQTI